MNNPTRLATILPNIAAAIDIERPMLSPLFTSSITVQIDEDARTVWLHCADEETHSFLSIPTQLDGVRGCFTQRGFHDFTITIHPITTKDSQSPPPPVSQSPTPSKRTANALTFHERKALENWMQQPDNTHFVAHESDADAARQATQDLQLIFHDDPKDASSRRQTFPDLTITPGNIASMRKLLGIEKVKPQKPQPLQLPEDLSLADLQARVQSHEERLNAMHVEATGMKATIAELHDRLKILITLKNYNADPACCIQPLSDLPSQSGPSGQ